MEPGGTGTAESVRALVRLPDYGVNPADARRHASFLAERLSMLFFALRGDLDLRQIGR